MRDILQKRGAPIVNSSKEPRTDYIQPERRM